MRTSELIKKKAFLKFEKEEDVDIYKVTNRKTEYLGDIEFDKNWKKWVFQPEDCTQHDAECLFEIVQFLRELAK